MKDCVSLDVALKLQKSGYKKDVWDFELNNYAYDDNELHLLHYDNDEGGKVGNDYVHTQSAKIDWVFAPTATQLAEELPRIIKKTVSYRKNPDELENYQLEIIKIEEGWRIIYQYYYYEPSDDFNVKEESLPDALGLMMVYLLEHKLITL